MIHDKEKHGLNQIYMQAPVAIGIYLGENHIVKFANPKMCNLWDRDAEQVIDKPLFEAIPEVAMQGFEEILAEVLATGIPFSGNEIPATLKRNNKLEVAYFNIVYEPLKDENEQIYGIIQTATEVTELVEARRKVEKNEEILKVALESGKMGTWYMDFTDDKIIRSLEHDKIFGYISEVDQWTFATFIKHVVKDERKLVIDYFEEGIKKGSLNFETRIKWADGSIHWINIKGRVVFNLSGNAISISGIIADITDQKNILEKEKQLIAEMAARKESDRQRKVLSDLFMEAPALICTLLGKEFKFDLVNPMYMQLFPHRDLVGKPILEAVPEIEGTETHKVLEEVYTTGKSFFGKEFPIELIRKESGEIETCYFNFVYQPIKDTEGKTRGILCFAFEITDQILALKQIENSEAKLHLALDAVKMGTWQLDLEKNNSTRNLRHDQIFGYKEMLPEFNLDTVLAHVIPQDIEKVKQAFEKALQEGELDFEAKILRKDGQTRNISVSGKTTYQNGKAIEMVGVITDITQIKKSEENLKTLSNELYANNQELRAINEERQAYLEELESTNNQLKLINSDLDNFIYTASHDLKAPISNLEGLLITFLPELQKTDHLEKMSQMMFQSIEKFKGTLKDLSDIAQVQREETENQRVSFKKTFKETEFALEDYITKSGVVIETDFQVEEISFSRKNLRSIIYNLIVNAINYSSPHRRPEIKISTSIYKEGILLQVSDNGLGIPEKKIPKIFGMFKRLHDHVEGSGLGLYIVKRIIENTGGKIEVESVEDKGTTFKIYFKELQNKDIQHIH